jgi:small ubiquitin-related modifier
VPPRSWKEKLKDEKLVKELRTKAEDGDPDAMFRLGCGYQSGAMGVRKDKTQARAWFKRGAELHDVNGMAAYGELLLKGIGGGASTVMGLFYITRAADASNVAALCLGLAFAEGTFGLPQDTVQAKHWLKKVVDGECENKHADKASIEKAKTLLQELISSVKHINLKVVTQEGNEIYFRCKVNTPLQKLMHAFCSRQGVSMRSVRFIFDGDRVDETQTPSQLDMEDGDAIDVVDEPLNPRHRR